MATVNLRISLRDGSFTGLLEGDNKFPADAFTHDDKDFFLLLNGVNLKFTGIEKRENIQFCLNSYKKSGKTFFNDFRGSFSGALYDKEKDKWIIFTNHIGDQKLFYTSTDDEIIISSDLFKITQHLKERAISYTLDKPAAYSLLSYGYMIGDRTLVNEIKRLTAGNYLTIENSKIKKSCYYKLDNQPDHNLTEKEIVEQMDILFRKAIQLEFEKDRLYGYNHLVAMSGGLDCRMTNWVANKMGYTDITNYTFSQFGYLDMTLAQSMSSYLRHEWLFKALDHGIFLKDIDAITSLTSAQVPYYFPAHGYSMRKLINHELFGVNHTGNLGDVTVGTYAPDSAYDSTINVKATSSILKDKVESDFSEYSNNEIANFYVRGFNGIITSNFVAQSYTEVASPFLDVDFLNFCMTIPVQHRAHHKIYRKWVLDKYPDAAKFKWERINSKISTKSVVIRNKLTPVHRIPGFIIKGIYHNLGIRASNTYSRFHMNPFNYWYMTNESLRNYFDTYYNDNLDLLSDQEIKRDCEKMFLEGNVVEKMHVLSLLSAVKKIWPLYAG